MKAATSKLTTTLALCLAATSFSNAAVQVDYALGGSSFFTKSDNSTFSTGEAFLFYGSFEAGNIPTASSTSQEIEDDFLQLGIPHTDAYSGASFSSPDNETELASKQGYLIVTNNSDIGSSTMIAIITNSSDADWQFASDLSGPVGPSVPEISSDDAFTTGGQIVLGTAGTSGGFDTVQFTTIDPVPEPSSSALLGLGLTALVLRRRK